MASTNVIRIKTIFSWVPLLNSVPRSHSSAFHANGTPYKGFTAVLHYRLWAGGWVGAVIVQYFSHVCESGMCSLLCWAYGRLVGGDPRRRIGCDNAALCSVSSPIGRQLPSGNTAISRRYRLTPYVIATLWRCEL